MPRLKLSPLLCIAGLSFLFSASAKEQKNITADPGQNVTLTCQAPNNNIMIVEWSRADLGSGYVLVYRDGRFVPALQHPSFKNWVDLQDRQMKDGDVSLILKNVTINDTGTYECRACMEGTQSWEHNTIYLRVAPPGPTGGTSEDGGKEDGGSVGLIVGLSVSALLLVAAVGFWIYRKSKEQRQDPYEP